MFFSEKGCFSEKKKPPAGMHHTDHRAGDAPKPPFPIKSIDTNPEINPKTAGKKNHYLLVCTLRPLPWQRTVVHSLNSFNVPVMFCDSDKLVAAPVIKSDKIFR